MEVFEHVTKATSRLPILLFLLILSTASVGAQDSATVDETIILTFVPNVQFAPVYVGIEKGYFSQEGINLSIQHLEYEPDALALIATNEHQFGLVSGEEIIKARAMGLPVVSVYAWFQKYPIGIVVPDGSGIETVKDLAGHTVGIPGLFGASLNGLTALLSTNGMTQEDIQLDSIGFNAPDLFCAGKVEAAVVYINNEPLQIENRIAQGDCNGYTGVKVFPVSATADLVSNTLVTNEETIANNPELVQKMVTAFDQSLRDAINNPAEAYLFSTQYVQGLLPAAPLDTDFKAALEAASSQQAEFLAGDPGREAIAESRMTMLDSLSSQFDMETLVQFHVLLNTIDLWDADQLGYSALYSWQLTQEILKQAGVVEKPIDVQTAFTNDFLPSASG